MVEYIEINEITYAILIRSEYQASGIHFFTPDEYSQQLAYINHPTGKIIEPHIHNEIERSVVRTQEVLVMKKGILRVNFYDDDCCFVAHRDVCAGDVILLASGGHGFEVLEDVEMVEIKQGPYLGLDDKTRFVPIADATQKESSK